MREKKKDFGFATTPPPSPPIPHVKKNHRQALTLPPCLPLPNDPSVRQWLFLVKGAGFEMQSARGQNNATDFFRASAAPIPALDLLPPSLSPLLLPSLTRPSQPSLPPCFGKRKRGRRGIIE